MREFNSRPSTVVITGVSRGLGRALADELIRIGHTVLACARTECEIDQLSRLYPQHNFSTVDVASDADVEAWASRVLHDYGPPDFVLNNAAVFHAKAPLWKVTAMDYSEEVDVNIKGAVNVIRRFAPAMITVNRGVIVNFTSRWGSVFEGGMAAYCSTKWAIEGLTRALAEDLKPLGIAAVALNPGVVMTEMLQHYLLAAHSECAYPTPAEWARVAAPMILGFDIQDTGTVRRVTMEQNYN